MLQYKYIVSNKRTFRRNPDTAQTLVMNNEDSIRFSYYNPSLETVVIAHGWLSNQNTDMNAVIKSGKDNWNNDNLVSN